MINKPTKFCSQCGHPIDSDSAFCTNCGYKIKGSRVIPSNQVKISKTKLFIILAAVIGLVITIILISQISNSILPGPVQALYSDDEVIMDKSKARYPENFVWGLGGWLRGADEIWCVSSYNKSFLSSYMNNDLVVKIGGNWDRYDIYENMWNMVGCVHDYR